MSDLQALFRDLVRCETQLWNLVDNRLRRELDVPLSWQELLQVMSTRTNCRVYDIADELDITVGGTSKLVDRIEASGFCARKANPEDGRSSLIELTPAGKRLLAKATRIIDDELESRMMAGLSARQITQLAAGLQRLRKNISGVLDAEATA